MAQWLLSFTALVELEDLGLAPQIHVRRFINACNLIPEVMYFLRCHANLFFLEDRLLSCLIDVVDASVMKLSVERLCSSTFLSHGVQDRRR